MFCAQCGKELHDGQRFCGRCGTPTGQRPIEAVQEEPVDEVSGGAREDDREEALKVASDDVREEVSDADQDAVRKEVDERSSSLKTDETVAMAHRGKKSDAVEQKKGQAKTSDGAADRQGGSERLGAAGSRKAADAEFDSGEGTERLAAGKPMATKSMDVVKPGSDRTASTSNAAGKASVGAQGARPQRGEMRTAVMPPIATGNGGPRPNMNYGAPNGPAGPGGQPSSKRNRNKAIAATLAAVAAVVIVAAVLLGTQAVPGEQPTVCTLATLVNPVDGEGNELAGYEVTLVDRETGKEVSSLSVPSGGGFSIGQFRDAQGNQIPNGKYMLRFKDLQSGNVYDGRLVDIDNNSSNAKNEVTAKPRKWTDSEPMPAPSNPSPSPEPAPAPLPDPSSDAPSSSSSSSNSSSSSGSSSSSHSSSSSSSSSTAPNLPVEKVKIPEVNGMTRAEARDALQKLGLDLSIDEGSDDSVLTGTNPAAGEEVKRGTLVKAQYAVEPQGDVSVPDVVGKTCAEAEEVLANVELSLDYDGADPETVVLGTDPVAGEKVERGSIVYAVFDEPLPMVDVPDVTGKTCAEAERILTDEGLVLVYDPGDLDKKIEETDPVAGETLEEGSQVRVVRVAEAGDNGSNNSGDNGGNNSGDNGGDNSGVSSGSSADNGGSSKDDSKSSGGSSGGDNNGGNSGSSGNGGGSVAPPSSKPADAKSAYRAKVKEYQDTFGKGTVESVGTDNGQLAGLALVELLDLDGDGEEELLLGYYDKSLEKSVGSDGLKDSTAYQLEIWFYNGHDIERAYKGAMLVTNDGKAFARLYQYDDGQIVLSTAYKATDGDSDQSIGGEVLAFKDGEMNPVLTYEAHGVTGTGPESFEVDGEEVSRAEYESTVRHLSEDHDNYTYNMFGNTTGDVPNTPDGYTVYNPNDVIDITDETIGLLDE